jgi:predicted tellurium resistance membrane protein TerC
VLKFLAVKRKLLDVSCFVLVAAVIIKLAIWAVSIRLPQGFQQYVNAILLISLATAVSVGLSLLVEHIRPPKPGWEYLTVTLAIFFVVLASIYVAWNVWDRNHPHISPDPVDMERLK